MNDKKLESIFVPIEVAKLAKEKGFNEWCACCYKYQQYYANSTDALTFDFDWKGEGIVINIPTHYQLINWLNEIYEIHLLHIIGLWSVINKEGDLVYGENGNPQFEINEALNVALELIIIDEEKLIVPEWIVEHNQNQ